MNKAKETHTSLSYSEPGDPWVTKWIIQLVEGLTGRNLIEKKYNEVLNRGLPGKDLMSAALRELDINLCFDGFSIMDIPRDGPIIFIANHPFGVVDGLALGEIISKVRDKFAILVNAVLCRNPQLDPFLLPIDFREIPEAMKTNINTRQDAINRLLNGEAIAIFPSGAVATAPFPGKEPVDLEWKRFVVKLITQSKATVIPLYFHGNNSFWFQLASYIHMNLRLGLLLFEVKNKMGKPLFVSIGKPITPAEWQSKNVISELLPFLRAQTMSLGEKNP
jgi:putative hemolysin